MPYFQIYRDSIVTDALAGFVNLEQRAKEVSAAAFKRLRLAAGDGRFRRHEPRGRVGT